MRGGKTQTKTSLPPSDDDIHRASHQLLPPEDLQLRSGDWGWTCITDGFGLLAGNDDGLFPEPKLGIWRVDRERGLCTLDGAEGVTVPYRPMLGCIGVAPPRNALWETGINSMPGRGDMPAVRNNLFCCCCCCCRCLLLRPCSS